jgi:hypothetical protein
MKRRIKTLKPIIVAKHLFKFRNEHSTIDQVHRVPNVISKCIKRIKYCCSVLWRNSGFYKDWHILGMKFWNLIYDERQWYDHKKMIIKQYHQHKFQLQYFLMWTGPTCMWCTRMVQYHCLGVHQQI